jgi:hypothetical protein
MMVAQSTVRVWGSPWTEKTAPLDCVRLRRTEAVSEGSRWHGKQKRAEGQMGRKWSVGGPPDVYSSLFFRVLFKTICGGAYCGVNSLTKKGIPFPLLNFFKTMFGFVG